MSGFQTAWQKHMRKLHESGQLAKRFTFHDIRAKAGSDAKDGRLLGHVGPRTLRKVDIRKPEKVGPTNGAKRESVRKKSAAYSDESADGP